MTTSHPSPSLADLGTALETMKKGLVAHSTGGRMDEQVFEQVRKLLVSDPRLRGQLPPFLQKCRSTDEFWGFIQPKFETYKERRVYLAEQFNPLLDALEQGTLTGTTAVALTAEVTASDRLTQEFISSQIQKCDAKLSAQDFDGAITNARSLVEAVLREMEHRLTGVKPATGGDLVKQYKRVQKLLNLDPSDKRMHTPLQQVLTGLASITTGLAGIRNAMGDAHAHSYKPEGHHARLAVNAAKTLVDFLFQTYEYQVRRGLIAPTSSEPQ